MREREREGVRLERERDTGQRKRWEMGESRRGGIERERMRERNRERT